MGPHVLLIDEATAVLDPFIRNRFMLEIDQRNKKTGMTTIIATNIGTEIAVLKGRLLIMQKGSLVVDRAAENISDGFAKIRVSSSEADKTIAAGFSFLEQNLDGSISFLGKEEGLSKLNFAYQGDKRSISVDEIFIFYSDRKAI
ncbi:putrescine/spermidine ABC transporter ATPase protein [compost metagenome]